MINMIGVKKIYSPGRAAETEALKGIDLYIEIGEFVAVMGPSGSGKTTLLNIIGCMDRMSEGRYYLDGIPIQGKKMSELAAIRREKIGFVFQNFALMDHYTVYENVELPLLARGFSSSERKKRVKAQLEQLQLTGFLKKYPRQLSGGQQQRVTIARALITGAPVILADEPTGNLDEENGHRILEMLKEIHRDGKTIVMVTHNPDLGKEAERIIQLRDGRIVS